jgi:TusA-related sulfurtransferase
MSDNIVDCIGLYCPVPIAEAAAAIADINPGETVTILADDPGVESDFPNWCKMTGNELVSLKKTDEGYEIVIEKK